MSGSGDGRSLATNGDDKKHSPNIYQQQFHQQQQPPPLRTQPPSYYDNNSSRPMTMAELRSSTETRAVQAVPPFGMRDSAQMSLGAQPPPPAPPLPTVATDVPLSLSQQKPVNVLDKLVREAKQSGHFTKAASPPAASSHRPSYPVSNVAGQQQHVMERPDNYHRSQTAVTMTANSMSSHRQPPMHNGTADFSQKSAGSMSISQPDLTRLAKYQSSRVGPTNNGSDMLNGSRGGDTPSATTHYWQQSNANPLSSSITSVSVRMPAGGQPISTSQQQMAANRPVSVSATRHNSFHYTSTAAQQQQGSPTSNELPPPYDRHRLPTVGTDQPSSSTGVIASTQPQYVVPPSPSSSNLEQSMQKVWQVMSEENQNLRTQLDHYMKKAVKLQQLELNYQRILRDYEDLSRIDRKREALEQQRGRHVETLEQEMELARQETFQYREQAELLGAHLERLQQYEEEDDANLRHEVGRLNMIIANIVPQNKELLACKERQEIELQAQRETLEEQRNHIQILDKALNNAQEKVIRLDEEAKKQAILVQRMDQLNQQLQMEREHRIKMQETHKREKGQLEMELAQLKMHKKDTVASSGTGGNGESAEVVRLKRELDARDARLYELESKLMETENRYFGEMTNRAKSEKDSGVKERERIRELEECRDEASRVASDLEQENAQIREEIQDYKRRMQRYETRVTQLEAELIEKSSMIKVLQKRAPPISSSGAPSSAVDSASVTSSSAVETDTTRHRLAAARIRLLQSPSPKRYPWTSSTAAQHSKFPASLDTSAVGDYSSLDRPGKHYRQAMNDYSSSAVATAVAESPAMAIRRQQHLRTCSQDDYLVAGGSTTSGRSPMVRQRKASAGSGVHATAVTRKSPQRMKRFSADFLEEASSPSSPPPTAAEMNATAENNRSDDPAATIRSTAIDNSIVKERLNEEDRCSDEETWQV